MQEDGVRLGDREGLSIDLIPCKHFAALGGFTLLTHAGPNIGIQYIRILAGLQRIRAYRYFASVGLRVGNAPCGVGWIRFVSIWACDSHVNAQFGAADHQRMRHVVAVADESQLQSSVPFFS